jgi:hypothetical protein
MLRMPLNPLDDLLAHQTMEGFEHVFTGGPNSHDRP